MLTIDGYCTVGRDREFDLTAATLLKAMDRSGVERAVIAPVDRWLAVDNRKGNAFVLKTAAAYRDRFIPACSVNPWYGKKAIRELRRAQETGARLLVLHPFVQGYLANDELVWPVLEALADQALPVYVHTGMPGNATPWQVVDLAERFPLLDFIIGHCGATDFWPDMGTAAAAAPNLYFEASLARPFLFLRYLQTVGRDRGVMGSYAPLNALSFEWDQMRAYVPPLEWPECYGDTLARLLRKGGPL